MFGNMVVFRKLVDGYYHYQWTFWRILPDGTTLDDTGTCSTRRSSTRSRWSGSSAVLGFGSATEDRLELLFDYPERPFRDTIEFDRRRGEWSFLIEYRPGDGDWKTFAEYAVLPEGDGAPSRPDSGK